MRSRAKLGEGVMGWRRKWRGRRETIKLLKAASAITKTIVTYYTPYNNSLHQILGPLGSIFQSYLRLENILSKLSTQIPLQIDMALKKATT
jgi:hypothetical protein